MRKATPFQRTVYEIVSRIPPGRVLSYGAVATLLGAPRAARGVGSALCALDEEADVPWWRVVNREGRISTRCLDHTCRLQGALLEAEGVRPGPDGRIDLDSFAWDAAELDARSAGASIAPADLESSTRRTPASSAPGAVAQQSQSHGRIE